MKKTVLSLLALGACLTFSSCNSIESRSHFRDTFKGTYPGIQYNKNEWNYLAEEHEKKKISRISRDASRLYIVIDYPFSAILDTFAIPFDMEEEKPKKKAKAKAQ